MNGSDIGDDRRVQHIPFGFWQARAGVQGQVDECWLASDEFVPASDDAPVWPWGLGVNLLLGAAGYVVAVRRLSVPQRTLPRGTRVA